MLSLLSCQDVLTCPYDPPAALTDDQAKEREREGPVVCRFVCGAINIQVWVEAADLTDLINRYTIPGAF